MSTTTTFTAQQGIMTASIMLSTAILSGKVEDIPSAVAKLEEQLASIKREFCPAPAPAPVVLSYVKKERDPCWVKGTPEYDQRVKEQAEAQAQKRKEDIALMSELDEVEFVRNYHITSKSTLTKEEFLEEHAGDLHESKHDALWGAFLVDMGAYRSTGNPFGTVDLEDRDDDDANGDFPVDADDEFPDIEVLREGLADEVVCVITGDSKADMGDDDDLVETELGMMRESIADHLPKIKELLAVVKGSAPA